MAGILVGQNKVAMEDVPILPLVAVDQLDAATRQQLDDGAPLENPVAMPVGQLVQVSKTLSAYVDLAKRLSQVDINAAVMASEAEAVGAREELLQWKNEASLLIETAPLGLPSSRPVPWSVIVGPPVLVR